MDPYTFALVLGGAGLVTMAATGLAHSEMGPGGGHDAGSGAAGHDLGHLGDLGHTGDGLGLHPGHPGDSGNLPAASHAGTHDAGGLRSALLSLASPRMLFSLLVGFGLTGVVLREFVGGVILAAAAVLGAVVFERALVGPLWRFMFRFASAPASTLESSVMSEARATSGFDDNGQGLVAVEVDGQVVQCLGTLTAGDLALGVRVRAGDVLRVEDVDAVRNRCVVSYVGHGAISP